MSISDRLKQIIDYQRLTPNSFAKEIGVSQPRIANYLNGRDPNLETLQKICKTFVMIDALWLLTGDGEMIKKDNCNNENSAFEITLKRNEELVREIERLKNEYKSKLIDCK